jgi:hypothetical protein
MADNFGTSKRVSDGTPTDRKTRSADPSSEKPSRAVNTSTVRSSISNYGIGSLDAWVTGMAVTSAPV